MRRVIIVLLALSLSAFAQIGGTGKIGGSGLIAIAPVAPPPPGINFVPLGDLGTSLYSGFTSYPNNASPTGLYQGGLYCSGACTPASPASNGTNTPNATYKSDGAAIASALGPLLPDGTTCVSGTNCRLVVLGLGPSIAVTEFTSLTTISQAAGVGTGASVVYFLNGAISGVDIPCWISTSSVACYGSATNPWARYCTAYTAGVCTSFVTFPSGVNGRQVEVIWWDNANAHGGPAGNNGCYIANGGSPTQNLPCSNVSGCCTALSASSAGANTATTTDAWNYEQALGNTVRAAFATFPNLKLFFFSGRTYAGFGLTGPDPEPYSYEKNFSYKWLLQAQINEAVTTGGADSVAGSLCYTASHGKCSTVNAPWVGWSGWNYGASPSGATPNVANCPSGVLSGCLPQGSWAKGDVGASSCPGGGSTCRSDGVAYCNAQGDTPCGATIDMQSDGTHLTTTGNNKVGQYLYNFFSMSYGGTWFK